MNSAEVQRYLFFISGLFGVIGGVDGTFFHHGHITLGFFIINSVPSIRIKIMLMDMVLTPMKSRLAPETSFKQRFP